MEERTEEQLAADKAAIVAMRHAQANMEKALDRIRRLEYMLKITSQRLNDIKSRIGADTYVYNSQKRVHTLIDEQVAEAIKEL